MNTFDRSRFESQFDGMDDVEAVLVCVEHLIEDARRTRETLRRGEVRGLEPSRCDAIESLYVLCRDALKRGDLDTASRLLRDATALREQLQLEADAYLATLLPQK